MNNKNKLVKANDCLLPFKIKLNKTELDNCGEELYKFNIESSVLLKDYFYQYSFPYKSNITINKQNSHICCSTETAFIPQFSNAFAQYEFKKEEIKKDLDKTDDEIKKINEKIIPLTTHCSYCILSSAKFFATTLSFFSKYFMSFYPNMWETIYVECNNAPLFVPYIINLKQYLNNLYIDNYFNYKGFYIDKENKMAEKYIDINNSLYVFREIPEKIYEILTLMPNVKTLGFNNFMYEIIDNPWYPSLNRNREFRILINASSEDIKKIDELILEYGNGKHDTKK